MIDFNLTEVVVTLIGAGGFWAYIAARQKRKEQKEDALSTLLLSEIAELKKKVEVLINDKEELLLEIANLRSELAAAKAELHAMTAAIRYSRTETHVEYDGEIK